MPIGQTVTLIISRLIGRTLRRAAFVAVMTIFIVIAIYYFVGALMTALSSEFGPVTAQLIVGGIYAILGAICFVILWALGPARGNLVAGRSPEALMLILVEALMLGYELARKRDRRS